VIPFICGVCLFIDMVGAYLSPLFWPTVTSVVYECEAEIKMLIENMKEYEVTAYIQSIL
jgi:hypothetical protein